MAGKDGWTPVIGAAAVIWGTEKSQYFGGNPKILAEIQKFKYFGENSEIQIFWRDFKKYLFEPKFEFRSVIILDLTFW